MKVIIIKDCKEGKIDEVIETKPGYANNFLFKKELAVPFTPKNKKALQKRSQAKLVQQKIQRDKSLQIKKMLEKIQLQYNLIANDEIHVHGAITSTQIVKDLLVKYQLKIDKHWLLPHRISEIGNTILTINLPQHVQAKIIVVVEKKENEKRRS